MSLSKGNARIETVSLSKNIVMVSLSNHPEPVEGPSASHPIRNKKKKRLAALTKYGLNCFRPRPPSGWEARLRAMRRSGCIRSQTCPL